ncbi:hypothetical protein COCNU_scaffold000515G000020 [Cocos nucifera]|nr:hypothetical protein [Cocos nucifera]
MAPPKLKEISSMESCSSCSFASKNRVTRKKTQGETFRGQEMKLPLNYLKAMHEKKLQKRSGPHVEPEPLKKKKKDLSATPQPHPKSSSKAIDSWDRGPRSSTLDVDLIDVEVIILMEHTFLNVKEALADCNHAKASLQERLKKEEEERKLAEVAFKKVEEDRDWLEANLEKVKEEIKGLEQDVEE